MPIYRYTSFAEVFLGVNKRSHYSKTKPAFLRDEWVELLRAAKDVAEALRGDDPASRFLEHAERKMDLRTDLGIQLSSRSQQLDPFLG